ncbi:MAG TPA: HD domain-containing phosphohydrolase [Usitatibacter sp.]|jgi:putative two-component system response regulator|nr:HD domain-containing phosphohydrolase [Usitatibacter sp.]
MSARTIDDFVELSADEIAQHNDALKVTLSKLALEVNTALQGASPNGIDFINSAIAAVSALKGTAHNELRINCLLDAAHFFYVLGLPFNAIDPAAKAVQLATDSPHRTLLRKALTILGVMYADTGVTSKAIECYAQALDIAQALRDTPAECAVWNNLGLALIYSAQYRDALSCLEHVIRVSGSNPALARFRETALANTALCCLHVEDFARGLKASETSIKEAKEPHSANELVSSVLRENNYIRLLLEVNSVEKAGERCAIARRYAARSNSARADIAASIAEGLYEVQAGRVDVGISRLTATLERARVLRSMLREALTALVKAHEIIGQPEKALLYLREMMESLRQTQQENALKHVKLHLENVGDPVIGDTPFSTRLKRQEAALQGKVAQQELFRSRIEMLERLAVTAELRDDSTGEHSYRVGKLSALLAQEFGCDEDTCYMIELAARLHDIGKIGVPDAILLKPDKLNDAERQIMRTHTTVGAELLSKSNIPHMQMAEEIARYHHEWWNGEGYPGNLSGTAIPLAARITALADVFDALTHQRPYKVAWPIDAALDEISRLKGRQFEPQLTDLFVVLIGRLRRDYIDIDSYLGQAAHSSPFLQARSRIWNALHRTHDSGGNEGRLDLQR